MISKLQGGNFGHGFWSAGITEGANVNGIVGTQQGIGWSVFRIAVAATIGGTVSQITGGKFKNGAVTAAFAQAYNGEEQAKQRQLVKEAYDDLETSLLNRVRDEDVVLLTVSEVDLVVKEMSYKAINKNVFGIIPNFVKADTLFYNLALVDASFEFNGSIYTGGEVNYIGVGAMAARYGLTPGLLNTDVRLWNYYQYYTDEGSHNLTQIKPAIFWANYGHKNYNSGQ